MYDFKKWDIIYCSKFPESVQCKNSSCGKFFTLPNKYNCSICGQETLITNIIAKPRPIILWIDKMSWHNSMSFGIPLSASRCFLQIKIPHFCKTFPPGTGGEFFCQLNQRAA